MARRSSSSSARTIEAITVSPMPEPAPGSPTRHLPDGLQDTPGRPRPPDVAGEEGRPAARLRNAKTPPTEAGGVAGMAQSSSRRDHSDFHIFLTSSHGLERWTLESTEATSEAGIRWCIPSSESLLVSLIWSPLRSLMLS